MSPTLLCYAARFMFDVSLTADVDCTEKVMDDCDVYGFMPCNVNNVEFDVKGCMEVGCVDADVVEIYNVNCKFS